MVTIKSTLTFLSTGETVPFDPEVHAEMVTRSAIKRIPQDILLSIIEDYKKENNVEHAGT